MSVADASILRVALQFWSEVQPLAAGLTAGLISSASEMHSPPANVSLVRFVICNAIRLVRAQQHPHLQPCQAERVHLMSTFPFIFLDRACSQTSLIHD